MTDTDAVHDKATRLLAACRAIGAMVVTAESCTGGLIIGTLTDIAGSSDVVERGFVTYSNAAKSEMIGVPPTLIECHGAVSEPVARAMAEGALINASEARFAIAVTGIAGPSGGSAEKPVGLVHFGLATRGAPTRHLERRYGAEKSRSEIRWESVDQALDLLLEAVQAVSRERP